MSLHDYNKTLMNERKALRKVVPEKKADRQVSAIFPQEWNKVSYNYEQRKKIAEEGYKKNPYVKACIDFKAQGIATLPYIIERDLGGGKFEKVYDTEFEALLNKPNDMMGRTDLLRYIASDYLQFGGSFTAMSLAPRTEVPQHLYPLINQHVEINKGTDIRPISSYTYRAAGEIEYAEKEVMYVKGYNPNDYYYGVSDVYAIAHVVDLNNEMIFWNNNLLKNNGTPPVYLYFKDMTVDPNEAQRLSDEYLQWNGGGKNAGKPFVAGNGMEIKVLGFNNNELDWTGGIHTTGEMICLGLNVPPPLIMSHKSVTTGDRKLMERQVYMSEIIPKGKMIAEKLTTKVLRKFPNSEKLRCVIDKDQVWALLDDIEIKHKTVRADFLAGLTSHNESRTEIQFDNKDKDYFVQPMNVSQGGSDVNPDAGGRPEEN